MYFKVRVGVAPKEGCNDPSPIEVGDALMDVLAEHLNHDAAYDFTVVALTIGQQPESEDEFRSVPVAAAADAAVPDGEDPLNWLKMSIQGYDYLLADPQMGLATWHEARDRGRRRIVAACLAVARAEGPS